MNVRYFCLFCVVFCISLISFSAHAATKAGGSLTKTDQDVMRQTAKLGLSVQQLRDLNAAMKKDTSIGETVKGEIDKGSHGRELADFVQNEIKNQQNMMDQGQGMSQGMGMNGSGMRMGQSMGSSQSMSGSSMGGGCGMMGGRGMGMGRGMRGRR